MLDRPAEGQVQEKGEASHPVLSTADGQRFLLTPRAGRNVGASENALCFLCSVNRYEGFSYFSTFGAFYNLLKEILEDLRSITQVRV